MSKGKKERNMLDYFVLCIVILTIFICLIGMVHSFSNFYHHLLSFHKEYAEALDAVSQAAIPTEEGNAISIDDIDHLITHMENLQVVQKNSITNDLMSFVYSLLSSILVGLCAKFMSRCSKDADEAKNSAREVQNAKESLMDETKKQLDEGMKSIEETIKKVNSMYDDIKMQNRSIDFLQIHTEITYAGIALLNMDCTDANYRFKRVNKLINTLLGGDSRLSDIKEVNSLHAELNRLNDKVKGFLSRAITQYNSKIITLDRLTSFQNAANNYYNWIDDSIEQCEKIENSTNPDFVAL